MKSLSPIVLFVYNRPWHTKQTVEALKKNYLAPESELFVFSDGPKDETGAKKVKEVRQYIKNIDGFKTVTIYESPKNKGLANSIISGVSQIIAQYGRIIVLEDDLITTPNFLDFMNQALDFYENNSKIYSISGYTMNLPSLKDYLYDYYLGYRASSWGWGIWLSRWEKIDWEVKTYAQFKNNPIQQLKFMRGGSDLPRMLKNQMNGKIDSWAIRWCYDQFLKNQLTVFTSKSKVVNIGFSKESTHTKNSRRFKTRLNDGKQRKFYFDMNPNIDRKLTKEFKNIYSIYQRLIDKIL